MYVGSYVCNFVYSLSDNLLKQDTRDGSRVVSGFPETTQIPQNKVLSLKFYIMHIMNSAILYNAYCMSVKAAVTQRIEKQTK